MFLVAIAKLKDRTYPQPWAFCFEFNPAEFMIPTEKSDEPQHRQEGAGAQKAELARRKQIALLSRYAAPV